ncbi:HAMP domain-containing protein [Lampropedia puyangensis]|uniref:Sensor protein n=2 Tax=Lampropedia puyangensis TaxID=1330072 RepID=A0A4S8EUB5_9BURK|nr:HAMP domain-containing protein [Lampropedia puyangensis]
MITCTLWLSWRLEGAGAAINDTGSLRMRAQRIAVVLLQPAASSKQRRQDLQLQLDAVAHTLQGLAVGDAQRPLLLPSHEAIRTQFKAVESFWLQVALPAAEHANETGQSQTYLASLPRLAELTDTLVKMIEQDNASKTTVLRAAQGGLAVLAVLGTIAMIYLLYVWIIAPVHKLRDGLQSVARHNFSIRLPVETRDEFGVLATGYNQMADELEDLYKGLEQRVTEKTQQLATQNAEISILYDMAAFLNQPSDIETMSAGFLQRIVGLFDAQGASIRTLDRERQHLSLVASVGLSQALIEEEHCMHVHDCHCGSVAMPGKKLIVIRDVSQTTDFLSKGKSNDINCHREGFSSVAVFRISARENVLGTFSLHFTGPAELPDSGRRLLESLGSLLGVALENRRLEAQSRELAVVQERNLVAQGLHDSLAQGLNFLNLQLQLLEEAVVHQKQAEIDEILPLLRTGVQESYQDVRELLTNFRSKLERGDFIAALEDTVKRFRRQTSMQTALDVQYGQGAPLAPEQQLQVLFILQEALSNVRKHSEAQSVQVRVSNDRDFTMSVRDDGLGYDSAEVSERGDAHVGLRIMRERAARMNAHLELAATPGKGASVVLRLPVQERIAA